MRAHKKHFTLVEVLIALFLVVTIAFPLLYPHVAIYKENKRLLKKAERGHLINQWFASLYKSFLLKERSMEDLAEGQSYLIDELNCRYTAEIVDEKKNGNQAIYLYEIAVKDGEDLYKYHLPVRGKG